VYHKGNTKQLVIIVLFILGLLVLMRYTDFNRVSVSPIESSFRDILSPVQELAMNIGHRFRRLVSLPFAAISTADENQLMKKRITELEGLLRQTEELKTENERLKKLLDFKTDLAPAIGFQLSGASVIGRDPNNWFGIITINKGSDDGIKPNMTVLNQQGLIGRITSVSSETAEVLLITDPRSGVSALVQQNRVPGMVEGVASYPGQVRMVHISLGSSVEKGEAVVTSGVGSIYPKGVPIGWIQEVGREPSGLFGSAEIIPYVDFNRLEEVMIVTGVSPVDNTQEGGKTSALPYPWGSNVNVAGRNLW